MWNPFPDNLKAFLNLYFSFESKKSSRNTFSDKLSILLSHLNILIPYFELDFLPQSVSSSEHRIKENNGEVDQDIDASNYHETPANMINEFNCALLHEEHIKQMTTE